MVTANGAGTVGATASCATGSVAMGGGYTLVSGTSINASFPVVTASTPTGWKVTGSANSTYTVYVVCAR